MTSDNKYRTPKALIDRHKTMKAKRSELDNVYQELKELVRPDTSDFYGANMQRINPRRRIFDGTAPWANEQLSSGLHSFNTSPVDRWFSLGVAGVPFDQLNYRARRWLETASETTYAHFQDPVTSFNPALHETYSDLGTFGTAVLYEWYDRETDRLMFRAYPLADCWIDEAPSGLVDRVHRRIKWTVEQVEKEFGFLPPDLAKIKREKRADQEVTIIHAVYPNDDYAPGSKLSKYRRWKSCFFCEDTEETLEEGGYELMPYHVPRWARIAGEIYGRGPGLAVLPEIRMANEMSKTLLVAAQKLVDPPLQVPDDGFMLPLRLTPGGKNYYRAGTGEIKPMPMAQRIDVGIEMIEQRREMIRRGFYVDWLLRSQKKERQTAYEIGDERNQMLSMMGPVTGRLQNELLGPMLRLSFALLSREGKIPPPPPELAGGRMDVSYLSPAARAQSTTRGQGLNVFVDRLVQLGPVMPELLDEVDPAGFAAELADHFDVPRRALADPAAVEAKRKARAEQQQAQQMSEMAPAVGKAAKDLAQAQQAGFSLQQ